jgi:hypothetical protein
MGARVPVRPGSVVQGRCHSVAFGGDSARVRLHKAVCSVIAVTAVSGGCGERPAADLGEPEAARTLSEFINERRDGTLTNVRCRRESEHEYRCTGDYRDPLLDNPALVEAIMSTEKDGVPSQSRESAMRQLESVFVTPRRYIARFDRRERAWSYERLCERCQ